MICITGQEKTVSSLQQRLLKYDKYPLQEVRLDLLDRIDESVFPLLRSPKLIVTCRNKEQGGGFVGDESARFKILRRALEQKPGYLDVEFSAPKELRDNFFAHRESTRLIVSWHYFKTEKHSFELPLGLDKENADIFKVAVAVEDAAELGGILDLEFPPDRPVLRIGMGDAGVLSRVLYQRFGSPWTYVIPEKTQPVAPGQVSVSEAEKWRVAKSAELTPLGVVGGPQVMKSLGQRVYNRLFVSRELPFVYLPIVTNRPTSVLSVLKRLGFAGCSVTMPAKEELFAEVDNLVPPADKVRAVNTILFKDGAVVGLNTDVVAVKVLLSEQRGSTVLVLGAGGAARAAVTALLSLDCKVTLASRNSKRASLLAEEFQVGFVTWEKRGDVSFNVLVNATPCGSDGVSTPMPKNMDWQGKVVLDAVHVEDTTPLLRDVIDGGGHGMNGVSWWLNQGALQMEAFLGKRFSVEDIEAVRCEK
ncbi:MAG: type I 3-dehydroquinate dehydratase [Pseudomonadota bacterium]